MGTWISISDSLAIHEWFISYSDFWKIAQLHMEIRNLQVDVRYPPCFFFRDGLVWRATLWGLHLVCHHVTTSLDLRVRGSQKGLGGCILGAADDQAVSTSVHRPDVCWIRFCTTVLFVFPGSWHTEFFHSSVHANNSVAHFWSHCDQEPTNPTICQYHQ